MMLVNEIGLSWLYLVRGDFLGMGEMFVSFYKDGIVWCLSE